MTDQPPASDAGPLAEEALRKGTEFLRSLGVESARLEMEIILAEVLELDRLGLYLNLSRRLSAAEREASRAMLARRRNREPLAYILGRREFYGFSFAVSPAVLVPRPETELLVDLTLEWLAGWSGGRAPLMADIGTGSGAIAIAAALVQEQRGLPGPWIATDVSAAALEVARENAAALGAGERVEFREGSLYEPIPEVFDLIVSNPPYIAEGERASLMPEVAAHEPGLALFSGASGLGHLEALVAGAPARLQPGGVLLMEIGHTQRAAVEALIAGTEGLEAPTFHRDLTGVARVVRVARAG